MKVIKRVAPILTSLVLCLSSFSLSTYAETIRQDGLEVSLSTDKDTYGADENIKAELIVTNKDADGITDIKLENIVPEGYVLVDGEEATKSISRLEKGESVSLEVIYVPTTDESSGSSDNSKDSNDSELDSDADSSTSSDEDSSNSSTSSDSKENKNSSSQSDNTSHSSNGSSENNNASDNNPQTGDGSGIALAIAAVAILTAICSVKTKQGKKMLSIVLAVTMVGSSISFNSIIVDAESSSLKTVDANVDVLVGGNTIHIKGKVDYSITTSSKTNVSLDDFKADTFDIYINEDHLTTFTVKVISDPDSDVNINVYDDQDEYICKMNDNGIDGDEIANDNIYAGTAMLSSEDIKLVNYRAICGITESDQFEISFYRDLTQDEFISFTQLMNTISEMPFEEACDYIANSTEIKSYDIDSDNKIISFVSIYGIGGVWDNSTKQDTDDINNILKGTGEYAIADATGIDYTAAQTLVDRATITTAQSNHNVIALRPFRSTEFTYDDFSTAAHLEADALNGNATVIDDGNVTVEVMKNLSSYGTVLIDSHGTLKDRTNPYMLIGEELDENKFLWDIGYYFQHVGYSADYLSGRIYCTGYHNRLAVGGKFFDKYYSDNSLNNSLWYLGTCYSMHNDSISSVLTKKGAKSVLGFSEPVSVGYCNNCLFEIITNTMIISADTVANGYVEARRIYGTAESNGCELRRTGDALYKIVNRFEIPAEGTLSGKVCRANEKDIAIAGARVRVYQNDSIIKSFITDDNGNYSTKLPEGDYTIEVSAEGYITFEAYTTVIGDETTYLETFLLVDESEETEGIASGTITDALTGNGLDDVNLTVRNGWNNTSFGDIVTTANTNSDGEYSLTLPLGNYTLYATKENYVSNTVNIVVQEGKTSSQNGTLTPISEDDTFRIVLTWGENPRDLDSHVYGHLSNGDSFHVYYDHQYQFDGDAKVCDLDVDDTTSYGPETITLNPTTNESYYYYIYKYAGSGTVASSSAQIRVYHGDDLIRTFNVPTNLGESDYWNVFAIKNGELIVQNSITDYADTNYAD